jgi:Sec-independent protein secretion pathway component TatC
MLIELAPLVVLFELSLLLARLVGTPAEPAASGPEPEPPASPAS